MEKKAILKWLDANALVLMQKYVTGRNVKPGKPE